jgi:TRAP-type C4-dicarboxylate transport system permease large subunit
MLQQLGISLVLSFVLWTVAFFVACYFIQRNLDHRGIPESTTQSLVKYGLAAAIACGVAFIFIAGWVAGWP